MRQKLKINFIAKNVNFKGTYKVDKNTPSKYKNLKVGTSYRDFYIYVPIMLDALNLAPTIIT